MARPNNPREQSREALTRSFDPWRHNATRNDRRLEQTEVVLRKVKHLIQARNLSRAAQINTGET